MSEIDVLSSSRVEGAGTGLIDRARGIREILSAEAAGAETNGQLSQRAVEAMVGAGLPWSLVPEKWGGSGVTDIVEMLDVLEEVSYADGSAGWVLMATAFGNDMVGSILDPETAESMVGSETRGIVCGAVAQTGRADRVDGGYKVSGRWQFGSGANYATFFVAGCVGYDRDGRQMTHEGNPAWILPLIPAHDVELLGNWNVSGLQGTASWDYAVNDVFVPDARIIELPSPDIRRQDSVFRLGFLSCVYAQHSGVALGVMKRAFAELASVIAGKKRVGYEGTIGESPVFLYEFARKEAEYRAVRAGTREAFDEVQNSFAKNGSVSDLDMAKLQVTCAWMTQSAMELVAWCHSWGGSASVREPSVLSRCLRDISVAGNHLYVDRINLVGGAGRILHDWRE
ncbi:acyl-CoA dehydrogenase family protein [Aeromicrobium wangtongii]|uniref:Acyl-CoA dehydrogenase family protein n=1 Tax=Aeromicrobium wangtongii TaxID=2969247 RepID=A0ABY5MCN0_9ACTN|nr:acyl-CoA dehydrogenase family protein [Aeromicrobium wangtongii]MCD9196968.1 acyl-CoA dehydrogenase family protein [Aeromicrobium wangtongii]UUP14472.1 acyl-CoA dehydrogenase family protein [Aeromicrobium wangtongii]